MCYVSVARSLKPAAEIRSDYRGHVSSILSNSSPDPTGTDSNDITFIQLYLKTQKTHYITFYTMYVVLSNMCKHFHFSLTISTLCVYILLTSESKLIGFEQFPIQI